MLSERPLLTIAVPTYNRAHLVGPLLAEFKRQLRDESRVEMIVSNNASTDGTKIVVDSLCDGWPNAVCLHNERNIGADANFIQCFEKAAGRYLWIFSDDDFPAPGCIETVLDLISRDDYDLIYVNSYIFDDDPTHSSTARKASRPAEVFTSASSFAARIHVFFTFISANIINKDRVIASGSNDFSGLVGSNLAQLGWVCPALEAPGKKLYIHARLVGNRADNTGGYALCQIFGVNLKKIAQQRLANQQCRRIILNGTIARFFPHHLYTLIAKEGGSSFFSEDPHQVLIHVFGNNCRYWVFVYPVISLPARAAGIWLLMGRIINKVDKSLGSPMLRWP